jgi:transglutaminase-like putative cysteine protease
MRTAAIVAGLLVVLIVVGLPGLVGLVPQGNGNPWGVTTYEFAYAAEVSNFGTVGARNLTARIALLRDFEPFQRVERMDILTPGYATEVDELGNEYAVYQAADLAPGASLLLTFAARVRVFGIDFHTDGNPFTRADADAPFTAPEPFVESSDPRIVNESASLRANHSSLAGYAYASYAWTARHLTYETQPQERGAVWALKTGRGMCYEYANLYMALLRAQGVAAKRVNGWGERFAPGEVHRAEEIAHAWVLVRTAGHGWLPVDPTFGDVHLYENYLKTNDLHVILTEGVNRHFYRVAYDRSAGVNVQVDYAVHVLSMHEENLSLGRTLVFAGFVAVPILLSVAIILRVVWERHRRNL